MNKLNLILLAAIVTLIGCAQLPQHSEITRDSGRPLTDRMLAYDVEHYTLRHRIDPATESISGSALIRVTVLSPIDTLELDFDGLFMIEGIESDGQALSWERDAAKLYIDTGATLTAGTTYEVTVSYNGKPLVAPRAPWDGGFVWSESPSGKPWIATAMQGEGCDIWWPCKDHPTGEPKSMDMYYTVPGDLFVAANGVLVATTDEDDGWKTYHWRTRVQTNTYGVALNIGPYIELADTYESVNGTQIPVRFWPLEEKEEQARAFFEADFPEVIEFMERKLGPYPWGEEKLGVVETPHLGMEHQTINAYGNDYRRQVYGYDYLLHHELAHEWFGNLITHRTVSDMWLHEGFGTFMQPEFTREIMGEAAFHASMFNSYLRIRACNPLAPREEMSEDQLFDEEPGGGPAGDIYSKGSWVLHTLRYVIGEDALWRSIRRLLYDTAEPNNLQPPFTARLRTTDEFVDIVNAESGQDLGWFFEGYVRRGPLPELVLTDVDDGLQLEWTNAGAAAFPMPVPVRVNGDLRRVTFDGNRALINGASSRDVLVDPFMQILRKLPSVPTCEERIAEEAE